MSELQAETDQNDHEETSLLATCHLSAYSLDNFVSQELSKLTACNFEDLTNRFPQSTHWIGNFTLNSMFGRPVNMDARRFCLAFLRRAEAAFFNYELGRQALSEFEESVKQGKPKKTSVYFRALHFFETCLAMQWQAIKLFERLSKQKPFQKGDGSTTEKLNQIHNASKHYDPADLPGGQLHAVWITNEGLNIQGVCLTFAELEELMVDLGKTADYTSSVSFFGKGSSPTTPNGD
jgi:hypothetical protein